MLLPCKKWSKDLWTLCVICENSFYYLGNWNILLPKGKKINRDYNSSGERNYI